MNYIDREEAIVKSHKINISMNRFEIDIYVVSGGMYNSVWHLDLIQSCLSIVHLTSSEHVPLSDQDLSLVSAVEAMLLPTLEQLEQSILFVSLSALRPFLSIHPIRSFILINHVAHLANLRLQIPLYLSTVYPLPAATLPTQRHHRHPLPHAHLSSWPLHCPHFFWIVRQQPDPAVSTTAQVDENRRREAVAPRVRRVTQQQVRLDRVAAEVLQVVRFELLAEADAAAFLAQVHDHAARGGGGG
jgi:hypothetical protein